MYSDRRPTGLIGVRSETPEPKYSRRLDRYELSREIGRGGMAVVYLARQTDLDRWVALKELHPEPRDGSVVKRFLRESRLAGSLSHPNIVTVLDFFEVDGTGYIAMEYVPRGSLRPYVGGLTFAQVAGVLEGVLAGLSCAEREGIVHRALKPENVMVTADGRVKLADFGIAKATGATSMLTATGTTLGTPHYMAPEQAMGQAVGPWTDLYSVGCMAYELVTGRLPFGDVEAPMAVLLRHINEAPVPACAVAPDVDPRLSDWISVLMAKDPAARPQSAAEAWDTLEELVLAVAGPRWRRTSALPARGTEQVPGPYTPPPSSALPSHPVFETFHAPPPARPPIDLGSAEEREAPASTPEPRTAGSPGVAVPLEAAESSRAAMPLGPAESRIDAPGNGSPGALSPTSAPTAPPRGLVASAMSPASTRTAPPRAVVAEAGPAPPRRRRRAALVAMPLAGVAVLAAALLPRGENPPPRPRPTPTAVARSTPIDAGKVHVTLPPGWSALSLPVVVPGLPRARAAAPSGRESSGVVLVGMAPRSAHRPALLSPELGAAGGSPASVRLGRLAAYRHDGLRWNGRPLTVYAAPTSAGVATVACLSPASSADCRRIAESLDVPGANGFPLGPDPAFAAAVNRALKRPERSLAGSTAKAQADAARRIAGDFRTARARLGRVAAGPADAPLVASLTKPLSAAVEAYGELAAAADANGRRRYTSAAKRVHAAELALRKAVRTSVYRDTLRTPHAQAIPSLRRPPAVEKPAPAPPVTPDPPARPGPTPQPTTPTPTPPKGPRCDFDCGPKPPPTPTDPDFGGEG